MIGTTGGSHLKVNNSIFVEIEKISNIYYNTISNIMKSKKKTPYKKSTKKIDINSVKSFDFKDFFKYYFGNLFLRFDTDHIFLSAGGLAFSLFICMIPLVLIIFSVLGNILDSSNMQAQINNMIDSVIPYSQYSSYVKKILFSPH